MMEYIPMEWLHVKSDSEKIEEYDDLKLECEELRSKLKETQEELFESDLKAVQAERDALQARIDGALLPLKSVAGVARHWAKYSGSADKSDMGCVVVKAIEILTGGGIDAA